MYIHRTLRVHTHTHTHTLSLSLSLILQWPYSRDYKANWETSEVSLHRESQWVAVVVYTWVWTVWCGCVCPRRVLWSKYLHVACHTSWPSRDGAPLWKITAPEKGLSKKILCWKCHFQVEWKCYFQVEVPEDYNNTVHCAGEERVLLTCVYIGGLQSIVVVICNGIHTVIIASIGQLAGCPIEVSIYMYDLGYSSCILGAHYWGGGVAW